MAEDMRKILRILEKVHRVNYCSFCQEPLLESDNQSFCGECGNLFCEECSEHEMVRTKDGRLVCNYCIRRKGLELA